MSSMDRINDAAEKMLLSRISKNSDFYEYIKNPAVMKVIISELMKNVDKHLIAEKPYMDALEELMTSVDIIFSNRKSVYKQLTEHGITERKIQNLSGHKNALCRESGNRADRSVLILLQQLLEQSPVIKNVDAKIELAKIISKEVGQIEQIDSQLMSVYKYHITQDELSKDIERGQKALFQEKEYVREYHSQISTDTLQKVPKRRRIRYVDQKNVNVSKGKHKPNKKKTKLGVLLGMTALAAYMGFAIQQNIKVERNYYMETLRMGVGTKSVMSESESNAFADLLVLANDEKQYHYNVSRAMMKNFKEGNIDSNKFVNEAFEELGNKIIDGENVSETIELIAENFLKYKVCEAAKANIKEWGELSRYKKYEKDLNIENMALVYEGPTRESPVSKMYIMLNENVLFSNSTGNDNMPIEIDNIIYHLKKNHESENKKKFTLEETKEIYSSLNRLRDLDLRVVGNTIKSKHRPMERGGMER